MWNRLQGFSNQQLVSQFESLHAMGSTESQCPGVYRKPSLPSTLPYISANPYSSVTSLRSKWLDISYQGSSARLSDALRPVRQSLEDCLRCVVNPFPDGVSVSEGFQRTPEMASSNGIPIHGRPSIDTPWVRSRARSSTVNAASSSFIETACSAKTQTYFQRAIQKQQVPKLNPSNEVAISNDALEAVEGTLALAWCLAQSPSKSPFPIHSHSDHLEAAIPRTSSIHQDQPTRPDSAALSTPHRAMADHQTNENTQRVVEVRAGTSAETSSGWQTTDVIEGNASMKKRGESQQELYRCEFCTRQFARKHDANVSQSLLSGWCTAAVH